jgi:hypothetical protein
MLLSGHRLRWRSPYLCRHLTPRLELPLALLACTHADAISNRILHWRNPCARVAFRKTILPQPDWSQICLSRSLADWLCRSVWLPAACIWGTRSRPTAARSSWRAARITWPAVLHVARRKAVAVPIVRRAVRHRKTAASQAPPVARRQAIAAARSRRLCRTTGNGRDSNVTSSLRAVELASFANCASLPSCRDRRPWA